MTFRGVFVVDSRLPALFVPLYELSPPPSLSPSLSLSFLFFFSSTPDGPVLLAISTWTLSLVTLCRHLVPTQVHTLFFFVLPIAETLHRNSSCVKPIEI